MTDADNDTQARPQQREIEALTDHVSRWIGAVAADGVLCGVAQRDCRDTITQAMRADADAIVALTAELTALRQDANDAAVALAKAQADSERLDWLERNGAGVHYPSQRNTVRVTWGIGDTEAEAGTLRVAIDTARWFSPSPSAPPDEWTTMEGPPNGTPDTTEKT